MVKQLGIKILCAGQVEEKKQEKKQKQIKSRLAIKHSKKKPKNTY